MSPLVYYIGLTEKYEEYFLSLVATYFDTLVATITFYTEFVDS